MSYEQESVEWLAVCVSKGHPIAALIGTRESICMQLLRTGQLSAAEGLAILLGDEFDFMPLDAPETLEAKKCDCPALWRGWWAKRTGDPNEA